MASFVVIYLKESLGMRPAFATFLYGSLLFDQRWFHKAFLHSFLPGFLRGIRDYALSQVLPFCAQS